MGLDQKYEVFKMLLLWSLNGSKEMHGTCESRALVMDTFLWVTVFEYVREQLVTLTQQLSVRHDRRSTAISSCIESIKVHTDEAAISLLANCKVAYPEDIVLLNCLRKHRQYLTDHGNTFVVMLPVCTGEQEPHSEIEDVVEWGYLHGSIFCYTMGRQDALDFAGK